MSMSLPQVRMWDRMGGRGWEGRGGVAQGDPGEKLEPGQILRVYNSKGVRALLPQLWEAEPREGEVAGGQASRWRWNTDPVCGRGQPPCWGPGRA